MIGLSLGTYIGLASTSIVEVLMAGYNALGREGDGLAVLSFFTKDDFWGFTVGSEVDVSFLILVTR